MPRRRGLVSLALLFAVVGIFLGYSNRLVSQFSEALLEASFDQAAVTSSARSSVPIDPLSEPQKRRLLDLYDGITATHMRITPRHIPSSCNRQERTSPNVSTVEYVACCGLGHRLARMAAASHVAQLLEADLYGYWRCCDQTEVFEYLFGPEPLFQGKELLPNTNSTTVQFRNQVPGFRKASCPCWPAGIASQYHFYQRLLDRYTSKDQVASFRRTHLEDRLSLGVHIRAGNGETGDFTNKGRGIDNATAFVQTLAKKVQQLFQNASRPPVVFVATDTPSYVQALQQELVGIPVVDLPQDRPEDNEGVLFGSNVVQQGDKCLSGWDAALQDMMLLASCDMLLATKVSSFSHTMAMSLVLGRPDRKPEAKYCEMRGDELDCFTDVNQWCCKQNRDRSDNYFDMREGWREEGEA